MKYLYVAVLTTPSGSPKVRRPELCDTFSSALFHIQLLCGAQAHAILPILPEDEYHFLVFMPDGENKFAKEVGVIIEVQVEEE